MPAVGESPSLVVSEGRPFATLEQETRMNKYITPEFKARLNTFTAKVAMLESPTSTASTLQLTSYTPPTITADDDVTTLQQQTMSIFDHGVRIGSKNEAMLRAERDQAIQRAHAAADDLAELRERYEALKLIVERLSGTHDVADGPHAPPPPRANASRGAAAAEPKDDRFDGF